MARRPLYVRVADQLLEAIAEGRLRPGDRLPTEHELTRKHHVSRITVRQSLEILRQRGLIERYPGRGSFVRGAAGVSVWTVSATEAYGRAGGDTELQLIDWRAVRTPTIVAHALGKVGPRVFRLRGIRSRRGTPLSYQEIYTPLVIGRRLSPAEVRHGVFELIEDKLGLPAAHGEEEISAAVADATLARRLRVARGDPVLVIDFALFGPDERPLEFARIWYRADQFRRRNQLSRMRDGATTHHLAAVQLRRGA